MKIGQILTQQETALIKDTMQFRALPNYNKEKDSFIIQNIEYPTEEEAYEAIEEMELE